MSRSILLVSFQYPPQQASSGLLRTLSFSRGLSEAGWDVTVLTASIGRDAHTHHSNTFLLPENCNVIRACAMDAADSLSVGGKYPSLFDVPDRFSTWILSGYILGARHILKRRPDILFSTYPIGSAHVIASLLARTFKLKWVADFRDPMVLDGYPDTPARLRAHQWVEKSTVSSCAAAVVTNDYAKQLLMDKYEDSVGDKFHIIENGFDESIFERAEQSVASGDRPRKGSLMFLHSGSLYPDHRDPKMFFRAVKKLHDSGMLANPKVSFVFRASGYTDIYEDTIHRDFADISEHIEFLDEVDYTSSAVEMLSADGLLLFQGRTCNAQIPAKLYEYFRADRPILAMVDPDGATAKTLLSAGVNNFADMDSETEIYNLISSFITRVESSEMTGFIPHVDKQLYSREIRTTELKNLLEALIID